MNGKISILLGTVLLTAGCGGMGNVCDEGEYYEDSRLNEPVQVPEDLDNLREDADLEIPEAAPRDRTVQAGRCLESPPEIQSNN